MSVRTWHGAFGRVRSRALTLLGGKQTYSTAHATHHPGVACRGADGEGEESYPLAGGHAGFTCPGLRPSATISPDESALTTRASLKVELLKFMFGAMAAQTALIVTLIELLKMTTCLRIADDEDSAYSAPPQGRGSQEAPMSRPHDPALFDRRLLEIQQHVRQQHALVRRTIVQGTPSQAAEDRLRELQRTLLRITEQRRMHAEVVQRKMRDRHL